MKHLFIINPAAGSHDRTKSYSRIIRQVCEERGLDYDIAVSSAPGNCRELAHAAAETGEDYRIYACGGDGTLNEVVSGAMGYPNASVSVFSGGTGNDFTKIFSEPDAFRDLSRLLDADETEFDLISCNGDVCLNICSVGLDARIAAEICKNGTQSTTSHRRDACTVPGRSSSMNGRTSASAWFIFQLPAIMTLR